MKKISLPLFIFITIMFACFFMPSQTTQNSFAGFAPDTSELSGKNYTIVIDAGHGGTDPGSIGYKTKVRESDLNLKLSNMLKEKLEKACINVVMTRSSDESLIPGAGKKWKKQDMEKRKELIKETRPNMVVSIHQNSYSNHSLRGAQVFYDKTSDISKQIADSIQEEFRKNLNHGNKYASPGDYYMLKCTYAPSVIVECGFLSNAEEEKLLISQDYQEKIVENIYVGIIKFLNQSHETNDALPSKAQKNT